jgi:hypothetical protein
MAETTRLPAWLVPHEFAVWDMTFLALDAMRAGCAEEAATGMVAASGWIQGVLAAPVTGEPGGGGPDPDVSAGCGGGVVGGRVRR